MGPLVRILIFKLTVQSKMSTDMVMNELIDKVFARLHTPPSPNKTIMAKSFDNNIDIFWKEFKNFTRCTGPYIYQSGQFDNDYAISGRSHILHVMHSLPFTQMLSFVACWTTSKWIGIRVVE